MSDPLLLTGALGVATFSTRYLGVVLGRHIPDTGPWTRALNALPGCLIVSLVTVMLAGGSMNELVGASVALGVALATRSLPLTMVAGVGAVWSLRTFL